MSIRTNIAQGLKRKRKEAGRSVDDVGAVLGLSGKTISAWEVGRGQPDGDQLIQICRYLDARLSDFYGEECDELAPDESALLDDYRSCNDHGRKIIRENAAMAAECYPKSNENRESAKAV